MAARKDSGPRIRVVHFYKGPLLVARLENTPGPVLPTKVPKDAPPVENHPWCHGQLFSVEWEPDVQRALRECSSFEDLLRRMKHFKYRMEEAEPQLKRKPFYRL